MKCEKKKLTKNDDGEANYKNSLQYVPNCMCEWCNPFQGISSQLHFIGIQMEGNQTRNLTQLIHIIALKRCHWACYTVQTLTKGRNEPDDIQQIYGLKPDVSFQPFNDFMVRIPIFSATSFILILQQFFMQYVPDCRGDKTFQSKINQTGTWLSQLLQ